MHLNDHAMSVVRGGAAKQPPCVNLTHGGCLAAPDLQKGATSRISKCAYSKEAYFFKSKLAMN